MSFSDFQSIEQVIRKYPLQIRQERFLPDDELPLPDWLEENVQFALETKSVDESEAFFTESFIFPFLQYAWKQHRRLKLWSHKTIVCDSDLYGEPDYLVSVPSEGVIDHLIATPLLAVTEAKKEDFTKDWGQCLAGMIACQRLSGSPPLVVYGIVSTGLFWEFAKLDGTLFTKHSLSYAIGDRRKIYAMLDYIFRECEQQAQTRSNTVVNQSESL